MLKKACAENLKIALEALDVKNAFLLLFGVKRGCVVLKKLITSVFVFKNKATILFYRT